MKVLVVTTLVLLITLCCLAASETDVKEAEPHHDKRIEDSHVLEDEVVNALEGILLTETKTASKGSKEGGSEKVTSVKPKDKKVPGLCLQAGKKKVCRSKDEWHNIVERIAYEPARICFRVGPIRICRNTDQSDDATASSDVPRSGAKVGLICVRYKSFKICRPSHELHEIISKLTTGPIAARYCLRAGPLRICRRPDVTKEPAGLLRKVKTKYCLRLSARFQVCRSMDDWRQLIDDIESDPSPQRRNCWLHCKDRGYCVTVCSRRDSMSDDENTRGAPSADPRRKICIGFGPARFCYYADEWRQFLDAVTRNPELADSGFGIGPLTMFKR